MKYSKKSGSKKYYVGDFFFLIIFTFILFNNSPTIYLIDTKMYKSYIILS